MLGELLDFLLVERADHERREEPREDERRVPERLPAGELQLRRRQEERHAAELGDPDLEGDARPGRGLVEDETDRPAREDAKLRASRALGLQLVGELEQERELVTRPRRDPREAAALQLFRHARHRAMLMNACSRGHRRCVPELRPVADLCVKSAHAVIRSQAQRADPQRVLCVAAVHRHRRLLRLAVAPAARGALLPPGGGGAKSRDDDGAVPPRRGRGRRHARSRRRRRRASPTPLRRSRSLSRRRSA